MSNFLKNFSNLMGLSKLEAGNNNENLSRSSETRSTLDTAGDANFSLSFSTTTRFSLDPKKFEADNGEALHSYHRKVASFIISLTKEFNSHASVENKFITSEADVLDTLSMIFTEDMEREVLVEEDYRPEDLILVSSGVENIKFYRSRFISMFTVALKGLKECSPRSRVEQMSCFCGVFNMLIAQTSDLTTSWTSVLSEKIGSGDAVRADELMDTSVFVFTQFLMMVHFVSETCSSVGNTSKSVDAEFLPPLPWTSKEVQSEFGFQFTPLSDGDVHNSTPENNVENKADASIRSIDFDFDKSTFAIPWCPAMRPMASEIKSDQWTTYLADIDAVDALLVLVQKLQYFMRVLSSRTSAIDEPAEIYDIGTQVSKLMKLSIALEVEALFSVLCLMNSSRSATVRKYIHRGPAVVSTVLLDTTMFNEHDSVLKSLCFQRGIICLRLDECRAGEINRRDKSKSLSDIDLLGDGDGTDDGLMPESIGNFFTWVNTAFLFSVDSVTASLQNNIVEPMIVNAQAPSSIPIPFIHINGQSSTGKNIWPWTSDSPTPRTASSVSRQQSNDSVKSGVGSVSPFWLPVRPYRLSKIGDSATKENISTIVGWARFIEAQLKSNEGNLQREVSPVEVPWYLAGRSGRAWLIIFSILLNISNTDSIGKMSVVANATGRISMLEKVLSNVVPSVLNGLELFNRRQKSVSKSSSESSAVSENIPLLQIHLLLFLSRSVIKFPEKFILLARQLDLWDTLLCHHEFLLGGVQSIMSFIERDHEFITSNDEKLDVSSEINHYEQDPLPSTVSIKYSCLKDNCIDSNAVVGFGWICLHDAIFDLLTEVLRHCVSFALVSTVGYPRYEIVKLFESFKTMGRLKSDSSVFQTARWLAILIESGKHMKESVTTVPEFLSVIISLNICGQQILDADQEGDGVTVADPERKDLAIKMKSLELKRPFQWHAKTALIELMLRVKFTSQNAKWLDVYLTSSFQHRETQKQGSVAAPLQALHEDEDAVDGSPPGVPVTPPPSISRSGSGDSGISIGSPPTRYANRPPSNSISSATSLTTPGRGVSTLSKTPSVNTLRHLLCDKRCIAAVAYMLSEICLRAVDMIASSPSAAPDVVGPTSSPVQESGTVKSRQASEQDGPWLDAIKSPVVRPRTKRKMTLSDDDISVDSNPENQNLLSSLLSQSSKVVIPPQHLVYEIVRGMLEQMRLYSRNQIISDAGASSSQILLQITRIFRHENPVRRLRLQDIWMKKNLWHILFGNLMSYLKAACVNSSSLTPEDSLKSVNMKMRFLHQNLSLINAVMHSNEFARESFREFMVSSTGLRASAGNKSSSGMFNAFSPSRASASLIQQPVESKDAVQNESALRFTSYDPIQRKPYRFNEFRLMLSMALQPFQLAGKYRVMETILILMEMLFDGPRFNGAKIYQTALANPDLFINGLFPSNDDRPKIINSLGLPILITILPLLHVNDQICILNSVQSLVRGRASLINVATCSQMNPSLLDLILDVFGILSESVQDVAVILLQSLGKHSISVSQLKRVFRMMHSTGDFRPAYTSKLLNAFKGMIAENEEPRYSFVFEGKSSGIQLPCINKWPATKAYTFSTWIRVEAPKSVKAEEINDPTQSEYRPYILSLRCKNGAGMDIYLAGGIGRGKFKICLNSYGSSQDCSTLTFPGLVMTEGKWHYFAVSHMTSSSFTSKGEISVLLDDQYFRLKDSFPFPRFNDPILCPLLGDCPERYQNGFDITTMRGQLSAVYFFSDSLSEGQLRGIRGLGPSYVYSFEPHNLVHRDISTFMSAKRQTVDPVMSLLDGSLTPLIMLAYNPAVWTGNFFLDNTPDKNVVKWGGNTTLIHPDNVDGNSTNFQALGMDESAQSFGLAQIQPIAGKMHAFCRPGTYRNATQDAKIALDSLGGIKVLLPLFAQFDQPRLPVANAIEPNNDKLDTQLSLVVLELLWVLLDNSEANLRLMKKISGFSLIAYFLERVSPKHLSVDAMSVLWRLRERLYWAPTMQDSLVEHLLSNFKLWIFTSFEVQIFMADRLLSLCIEMPLRVEEALSVQRLLDALLLLYDYEIPNLQTPNDSSVSGAAVILSDNSSTAYTIDDFSTPDVKSRRSSSTTSGITTAFSVNEDILSTFINQNKNHTSANGKQTVMLTSAELSLVRLKLFKILQIVISCTKENDTFSEDLQSLISYALATNSGRSKAEVLRLILRIISIPPENASAVMHKIFSAFCAQKGIMAILSLQNHVSPKVRLYSFLIFCKLIFFSCMHKLPIFLREKAFNVFTSRTEADTATTRNTSGDVVLDNTSAPPSFEGATSANQGPNSTTSSSPEDSLTYMDTIGIPASYVGDVMNWGIDLLCDKIRIEAKSKEENIGSKIRLQCRIIAQALQSTMLGDSCDYLVLDVDKLDHDEVINQDDIAAVDNLNNRKRPADMSMRDILDPVGIGQAPDGTLLSTPTNKDYAASKSALSNTENSPIPRLLSPESSGSSLPPGRFLLSSSVVCVPMLFPAILSIVRFEGIQISLGLSILVNLKTLLLQNDHNADAILSVPIWQDSLLQLIVFEKKRFRRFETNLQSGNQISDSERRYYEKSKALIETSMRMICDLQLVAIRLGRLVTPAVLYNISDLQVFSNRYKGTVNIIKDISRGKRQLGASVLRDTVSYLRMYGEFGEIDAQSSGFEMLQQILSSLQLEKTLLDNKSTLSAPTAEEEYGAKVATLSKWLIGAIVFDFISIPIMQGKTSEATALSESEETAFVTPIVARKRLHTSSFDAEFSDSSDHNVDSAVIESSSVEEHSVSPENLTTREPFVQDIGLFASNSYGDKIDDVWKLIDALLNMYGPLNNATWWSVIGMKLKIVGKLGFLTGISALAQISDGVEQIMPNNIAGATNSGPIPSAGNVFRIAGTPNKAANRLESPLVSTAYSVCWLLTRALESVYLVGGRSISEKNVERSLDALSRLKTIMSGLIGMGAEFTDFESRNIVTRFSIGLVSTSHPLSSGWVKGGLAYICELLQHQRLYFADIFLSNVEGAVKSVMTGENSSADRSRGAMAEDSSNIVSAEIIIGTCLQTAKSATPSICDVLVTMLRIILRLPSEIDDSAVWPLWIKCVDPIVKEADRMAHESVMVRLNNIGLHKHTQEMKLHLMQLRELSKKVSSEINLLSDSSKTTLFLAQTERITLYLRQVDRLCKQNTSKWSRIVSELANERGPWGSSADENREVFWMADSCLADDARSPRLKRNEEGTDHRLASSISRGAYSIVGLSSSSSSASLTTMESAGGNASSTSGGLAQGLWRDLVKYQKKDVVVAERMEGPGEVIEAVEGEVEGTDGDIDQIGSNIAAVGASATEQILFSSPCEIITTAANSAAGGTIGLLEVTKTKIIFTKTQDFDYYSMGVKLGNTQFLWACQNFQSMVWSTSDVTNIWQRMYQLRYVAVELFFTNRRTVFINLHESDTADLLHTVIRRKVRPPYILPFYGRTPKAIIQRYSIPNWPNPMTIVEAWQCREISNFEYLMYLNMIAGRTFNDLSQYPVFPWIIADYTSKKLDLRNPDTFRDLRYPMGAQREDQRVQFMDKYYDLKANYDAEMDCAKRNNIPVLDTLPPFHYGSHYSCMGFVLWYLIRHEPFSSLGVWLQDGKFDKADRLFDSIDAAYRGCTTNMSDVKELIPEFFYLPDFLDNYNNIDLGTTQTGKQLGAVKLPRWAKNSNDFIFQNREALESDYVSTNLHHWIDLIFGYKQRPPHMGGSQAAVDSVNIYFHLTYAGAVDLDQLKHNDPNLYSQTVRQIDNFGQTPTQLFDKPHVTRLPFDKCDIIWPMASVIRGVDTIGKNQPQLQKPRKVICFKVHKISELPILFIGEASSFEKLVTVDSSRIVGCHLWQVRQPDVVPPYQLKVDPQALRISQGLSASLGTFSLLPASYQTRNRERRIGVPFAPQQLFSPQHLAETPVLYRLNKKQFCQEETDRLNARFGSSSSSLLKESSNIRPSLSSAIRSASSSKSDHQDSDSIDRSARPVTSSRGLSPANSAAYSVSSSDARSRMQSRESSASRMASSSTSRQLSPDLSKDDSNATPDNSILAPPQPRIDSRLSSSLFALLPSQKYIFSCGHWDNSFKVSVADTGALVQSLTLHRDVVTCLTLCSEYGSTWLITGSRDCTVMVWEVFEDRTLPVSMVPLHILYGHDDAVTCVAVNLELDTIVSGSDDGTIIVHSLRDGCNYIRSIFLHDVSVPGPIKAAPIEAGQADVINFSSANLTTGGSGNSDFRRNRSVITSDILRRVSWVHISRESYIVSYSSQDSTLCTHSINGKFLVRRDAGEHLHSFLISEDGKVLITGGDRCLVVMRWIHNLELANDGLRRGFEAVLDGSNIEDNQGPMTSPIRSLYLTKRERHLLVGMENGELRVMTQDSDYLRRRLHYKLMEIGILPQNHAADGGVF